MESDPITRLNAALEGRYRIERELGEGGMATVYLADDVRHGRKVAVKLFRPELAAVMGSERFLSEIRTTANLQHPHILPLFDSGETDSLLYYVMPHVEGESLRDRLQREKQLPIDEAVRIASEVADALSYAHGRGVIHRDIKPGNILLHGGRVLVADFGIALAVSAAGGSRLTETGLSVGTPQYMSPEQATGDRALDGRTDIYSLGAVTYEMLTGQTPHTGSTAQAILASVLTGKARPVSEFRDTVPDNTELAVEKALARLPADRFSDAAAFRSALLDEGTVTSMPRARQREISSPMLGLARFGPMVGAAGLGALATWLLLTLSSPSGDSRATHLPIATPEGVLPHDYKWRPSITISPDGRKIVYVGSSPGRPLYLEDLDAGGDAQPIPGTEGAVAPFFSPDGAWIGFGDNESVRRISLGGGVSETITEATFFRGGSWSPDGETVYLGPRSSVGLAAIPTDGGELTEITTPTRDGLDNEHFHPFALPDGRGVLFTSCCSAPHVMHVDVETGTVTRLVEGFYAQYAISGHIVYMQPGVLLAAPFDLETLEVGAPVQVASDVLDGLDMHAEFAISASGSLAYLSGQSTYRRTLVRRDRSGAREVLDSVQRGFALDMRFSPDGSSIAVPVGGLGHANIQLFDMTRRDLVPLVTHEANDFWPIWSPDGRRIAFTSVRNGPLDLFTVPADGSGEPELLFASDDAKWPGSWSTDLGLLFFHQETEETGFDILAYSFDDATVDTLLYSDDNESFPSLSPDGRWLAYQSDQSDQYEIYVMPFPGPGARCKISSAGGSDPRWSADGRELFYRDDGLAMVADVGSLATCTESPPLPETLFDGLEEELWAVHPSGTYFVTVDPQPTPRLRLVQNWTSELERLVPSND